MRRRPQLRAAGRVLAVLATVGLVCTATPPAGASVDDRPGESASTAPSVSVQLLDLAPVVPPTTAALTPLTVHLTITNTSSSTLSGLELVVSRESPLGNQNQLTRALTKPVEATDETNSLPTLSLPAVLGPGTSEPVTYTVDSSTSDQRGVLCLCNPGIYPVDFSVQLAGTELGWTQTYVPSLPDAGPLQVSWLWPLLDRPHRLTSDTTFTDDDLTGELSPGGRLDRSLEVLEQTYTAAHLTLVTDPELIDEVIVMSQGYRVAGRKGTSVGTGGAVARQWLQRLKTVLGSGLVTLSFTPWADPDVDAIARAGLGWSATTPVPMQQRITSELGVLDPHSIAWPAGQTITSTALARLAAAGASTVLLDDKTLPGGQASVPPLPATSTIPGSNVSALVTSGLLEQRAAPAINYGAAGAAALPALVATLAMFAVENHSNPSYVVLAPDREVNPDPVAAASTIIATTSGSFTPIAASAAVGVAPPRGHGQLTVPDGAVANEIPPDLVAAAHSSAVLSRTFASAVSAADAAKLLAGYPSAVQRCQSAGWRSDVASGRVFASALTGIGATLTAGVQIVRPTRGSYTLASNDAPLYITVVNNLPVDVTVRVHVAALGGVVGFTADQVAEQVLPARDRRMIRLQTHATRSGHFLVEAQLSTPAGSPLGRPQQLSIYNKALGTIGVVITFVAIVVLVGALMIRFARRLRHRRQRSALATRPRL